MVPSVTVSLLSHIDHGSAGSFGERIPDTHSGDTLTRKKSREGAILSTLQGSPPWL